MVMTYDFVVLSLLKRHVDGSLKQAFVGYRKRADYWEFDDFIVRALMNREID